MQVKNEQLKEHIGRVEDQTQDINTTTAALKNRTDELAAKQDEILKQIMLINQQSSSQKSPRGGGGPADAQGPNQTFNGGDQIGYDKRDTWKLEK